MERPAPIKPLVGHEALEQLDIRIGTIVGVDDVPSSKKLVALRVDFGDHERTIVAGLKLERADVTEIVGTQALFVVNLAPRTMAGVESQGMLFDIGYADGITPVLVVWHPRLKRHFSGSDAWKRAVRLSVHAPEFGAVFASGKEKQP